MRNRCTGVNLGYPYFGENPSLTQRAALLISGCAQTASIVNEKSFNYRDFGSHHRTLDAGIGSEVRAEEGEPQKGVYSLRQPAMYNRDYLF